MRKILFLILASVLVFGLGCSSRATPPKLNTNGAQIIGGGDQQQQQQQQQQQGDDDDTNPTQNNGKQKNKNVTNDDDDSDDDGKAIPDNGPEVKNKTKDNGTPIDIVPEIATSINDWPGTYDYVQSGFTIKDL